MLGRLAGYNRSMDDGKIRFGLGTVFYAITAICVYFGLYRVLKSPFGIGPLETIVYFGLAWAAYWAWSRRYWPPVP